MVFDIEELDDGVKNIIFETVELSRLAVSDYYCYKVGVILVDEQGNKFRGVNFEPSNGKTTCAESGVISAYLLSDRKPVKALFLYGSSTKNAKKEDTFGLPCGACRQMLYDFISPDTVIYGINETVTKVRTVLLEELLPYSFSTKNLE